VREYTLQTTGEKAAVGEEAFRTGNDDVMKPERD
jgi:hypothetical protein